MQFIQDKNLYYTLSNCIRVLGVDAIANAKSGHPGIVLGMADVLTVLVVDHLKFNPNDPNWFGRDRLVLSAGHGSMLLYAIYYLSGYKNFKLEDIKQFRKFGSVTPGHPEFNVYSGIETTTGPLGQGLANSVGMAIAGKKYQKIYGNLCDYKVFCIVGDGCLMEGISYEACSLSGHLGLNNLIVLFDDNNITIDGNTSLTISENHIAKFKALGWEAEKTDGHNFNEISLAINRALKSSKPYLIACKTIIGYGCKTKSNSEKIHGSPLNQIEISELKKYLGCDWGEFTIPEYLLNIWRHAWDRNKKYYTDWSANFHTFSIEQQHQIDQQNFNEQDLNFIKKEMKSTNMEATRISSSKVVEYITNHYNKVICGSADLSLSNGLKTPSASPINKHDFKGNFLHYGTRENAMGAIMNGLAIEKFLPVGGTFLVFSDYMRPSIRLSAMMHLQVIYIMTHDSIGVGEDGPTHQPIEHLASLRSIPNLLVLRPADFVETVECWQIALSTKNSPSILALTRQEVPQVMPFREENKCKLGAYVITEDSISDIDVIIFASGSEVNIALEAKSLLNGEGLTVRIISIPCFELLFTQSIEYINTILHSHAKLKIGIEAASSFGWERIIGQKGIFVGINEFGKSGFFKDLFEYYKITAQHVYEVTIGKLYNK